MAVREVGALLGLGILGGMWTVAWGIRRGQRAERSAILDARLAIQVRLDALRARTAALNRRELPPKARELLDRVVEQQVLVDAVLSRAASADEITEMDAEIADAFDGVAQAAELAGMHMPADAPFAGLCGVDPAHGLATAAVVLTDGPAEVCPDCARAVAAGSPPPRRLVTRQGRPLPFTSILDEAPAAPAG